MSKKAKTRKKLSEKQLKGLAKGQALMKKAVAYRKAHGGTMKMSTALKRVAK